MATKEESPLTREDVQSLITDTVTDIVGKVFQRSADDTTKQVNGAVARLSESISKLSNRFESVEALSTEVSATKSQLAELFTALQEPDDDPNQPSAPQASAEIIQAEIAKARAEWEENRRQDKERIQALEQASLAKDKETEEAKRLQKEQKRDSDFAKYAQELGVKPNRIDSLLFQMQKDGTVTLSEDGSTWLLKSSKEDPYVKGRKEEVLLPLDQGLPEIAQSSYSDFLPPRGGAGTNAAATQSYTPASRKITDNTTATDIQKIFKDGDTAGQEEIAALILAQG